MAPKLRNVILFILILLLCGGVYYWFFLRNSGEETGNIVSTSGEVPGVAGGTTTSSNPTSTNVPTDEFLALLLNVRNIKLPDSILNDPAFGSLKDSSITLTQDGTEGRPNPFAQFGNDQAATTPPTGTPAQ